MKWLMSAILVLLSGAATSLQAQPAGGVPPGKWWQRPEIVRNLSISAEQRMRLDGVFNSHSGELVGLRSEVERSSAELRGALDRTQLDREEIHRLASRVSESRAKLFERELTMFVEMRSVLNDEQWNRFRSFLARADRGAMEGQQRRAAPPMGPRGGRRTPGGRH